MKAKDIDQLINDSFKAEYRSGWYGFRTNCELHSYGFSNMSPMSSQEYCARVPKKGKTVDTFDRKDVFTYKKGVPRPSFDPLHCSWQVCPKLKDLLKAGKCGRGDGNRLVV